MEIFPFYLSRIHRPNRFVIPWHPVSYIIVDPWKLTEPPLSLCKINIEKAPEMHSLRLFVTCVRRFELPTPWSVAKCSIQLSYAHIFFWLIRISLPFYYSTLVKYPFREMPATGIEPVLYRYNRILSPARLPVPPRRHFCTRN